MEEKPRVVEASAHSELIINNATVLEKALSLSSEGNPNPSHLENDTWALFFPYSDLCIVFKKSESTYINAILQASLDTFSSLGVPNTPIFNDYSQNITQHSSSAITSFGKVRHLTRFSVFHIRVAPLLENIESYDYKYPQIKWFEAIASYISNLNIETSLTFTSKKSEIFYCFFYKKPHLDTIITNPLFSQISTLTGIPQDHISLFSSTSIDDEDSVAVLLDPFIE